MDQINGFFHYDGMGMAIIVYTVAIHYLLMLPMVLIFKYHKNGDKIEYWYYKIVGWIMDIFTGVFALSLMVLLFWKTTEFIVWLFS